MFTENAPIIERSLNCKISNILLRIEFIIFKFEMLVAFVSCIYTIKYYVFTW